MGRVPSIMTCRKLSLYVDDKWRSSSHKGAKHALKCMTLTVAKQVQAGLLMKIRMTRNAWSDLEMLARVAQFQQSRRVKWYYHNGVATVTDQNHTMSIFLSHNCLCECLKGPSHHKQKNTRSNIIGQFLFIWDYHARLCIDSCSVTYLPSTDIFHLLSKVSRAKLRSTSKGDKWISAKMKLWANSPCFWTYDGLPPSPWPIDSGPQVISLPSHSVITVCHSSLWLAWL